MDSLTVGIAVMLGGAGLLWVSWAGSQRSLRPNALIGIRLPATRRSDDAWYATHRAAAGPFGVGGGITAVCGVGVLFTGFDVIGQVLTLVALAATLTATGVGTAVGIRAARDA